MRFLLVVGFLLLPASVAGAVPGAVPDPYPAGAGPGLVEVAYRVCKDLFAGPDAPPVAYREAGFCRMATRDAARATHEADHLVDPLVEREVRPVLACLLYWPAPDCVPVGNP